MAISSGYGPHSAWLTVDGQTFLIKSGSVAFEATRKGSTFSCVIPLDTQGMVERTFGPSLGDNKASITVSSIGQTATLITGEIDETDFDYISGQLSISGRDATAKLHDTKSAEKWVNKKPHEIVKDIAGRVGLDADVDPVSLKAGRIIEIDWTKMTDGVSYGAILHKLAEFMGAHWSVKDSTLKFKSTPNQGAPYTINCSFVNGKVVSDCLRLRIRRNVQAGKPVKVDVKSWHTRKKQAFTGSYQIGGNGTSRQLPLAGLDAGAC